MRNKSYERSLMDQFERIENLDRRLDAFRYSLDAKTDHITRLDEIIVDLRETQRQNQLRIIALEAATTHKPYYIPTPAQPYKRWVETPGVIHGDWSFSTETTVDL